MRNEADEPNEHPRKANHFFTHHFLCGFAHHPHTHTHCNNILLVINMWGGEPMKKEEPFNIYIFSSVLLKRIGGPLRSRRIYIWWCPHNIFMEKKHVAYYVYYSIVTFYEWVPIILTLPVSDPFDERWSFMLRVRLIFLKGKWWKSPLLLKLPTPLQLSWPVKGSVFLSEFLQWDLKLFEHSCVWVMSIFTAINVIGL